MLGTTKTTKATNSCPALEPKFSSESYSTVRKWRRHSRILSHIGNPIDVVCVFYASNAIQCKWWTSNRNKRWMVRWSSFAYAFIDRLQITISRYVICTHALVSVSVCVFRVEQATRGVQRKNKLPYTAPFIIRYIIICCCGCCCCCIQYSSSASCIYIYIIIGPDCFFSIQFFSVDY